jgi:hypothetical protein
VFVIDEYGEVQGMVTLHDVIESVTGEFLPHDTEEAWAVQREDGSWLLDGLIPIVELKDRLGIKDRAGRGQGPLPHAVGHGDVAARPPARAPATSPPGRTGGWR